MSSMRALSARRARVSFASNIEHSLTRAISLIRCFSTTSNLRRSRILLRISRSALALALRAARSRRCCSCRAAFSASFAAAFAALVASRLRWRSSFSRLCSLARSFAFMLFKSGSPSWPSALPCFFFPPFLLGDELPFLGNSVDSISCLLQCDYY